MNSLSVYWLITLITVVVLKLASGEGNEGGCNARDFGHGSVVCVCNADGCHDLKPIKPDRAGEAVIVTSNKAGARWEMKYAEFKHFTNDIFTGTLELEIDETELYQEILGFGGAFTDAAGLNILSLPQSLQDDILSGYYSESGLEYNLGRVPIGGTDFSTHPYTYNDLKPGRTDTSLIHFALAQEDLKYKIPLLQRALALSPRSVKLFGSAWSAPGWMKTNGKIMGKGKLQHNLYSTWANYHIKFLESYAEHNITFWGLTAQNEPTDGLVYDFKFNAMGWTPHDQGEWIGQHLGPALVNASLGSVKVMVLDDNRFFLPKWMDELTSVKASVQYVSGIALHWYTDFITPLSILDITHQRYPDVFLLYTEACTGQWPWQPLKVVLGSWVRAEDYATNIIENLQHWVSGWTDWNLALDIKGGPNWAKNYVDSPIIVNAPRKEFYKQPMYYALAHFTKALPRGTRRIKLPSLSQQESVTLPVYRAAFIQPDGTLVLIIVNRYHNEVQVRIKDRMLGYFDSSIEPHSFVTIAWRR